MIEHLLDEAGAFVERPGDLCDAYDQTRLPALPLPIPTGAQPACVSTVAAGTELLIEMVATSRDVTILPSWLIAPHLATCDIATVAVGDPPQLRTWYSATRHDRSELVDSFVALLHSHLGGRPPVAPAPQPA